MAGMLDLARTAIDQSDQAEQGGALIKSADYMQKKQVKQDNEETAGALAAEAGKNIANYYSGGMAGSTGGSSGGTSQSEPSNVSSQDIQNNPNTYVNTGQESQVPQDQPAQQKNQQNQNAQTNSTNSYQQFRNNTSTFTGTLHQMLGTMLLNNQQQHQKLFGKSPYQEQNNQYNGTNTGNQNNGYSSQPSNQADNSDAIAKALMGQ